MHSYREENLMHICTRCGKVTDTVGYDAAKHPYCYDCCALIDSEFMRDNDRITLYLAKNGSGTYEITNWPGSLRYSAGTPIIGKHNMAGIRRDVWFKDICGNWWWGVQYGNDSEICHCKKLKHEPGYVPVTRH